MKLGNSALCVNCDEVFEMQGVYNCCPACGSKSFALISRWVPTETDWYGKWIAGLKAELARSGYDSGNHDGLQEGVL